MPFDILSLSLTLDVFYLIFWLIEVRSWRSDVVRSLLNKSGFFSNFTFPFTTQSRPGLLKVMQHFWRISMTQGTGKTHLDSMLSWNFRNGKLKALKHIFDIFLRFSLLWPHNEQVSSFQVKFSYMFYFIHKFEMRKKKTRHWNLLKQASKSRLYLRSSHIFFSAQGLKKIINNH